MNTTPFTIRKLDAPLGAELIGFDPIQHREHFDAVVEAWREHIVLVFRDQKPEPSTLLEIAKVFGEPVRQPLQRPEYQVDGFPELRLLHNHHIDTFGDGKPLRIGGSWHTDHSHFPVPPRATLLQAVKLPSSGGNTSFSNQRAAYESMPQERRDWLDTLQAHHVYNSRFTPRRMPSIDEKEKAKQPSAVHPVARPHPDTGRRSIYLNPVRVDSIDGVADDEVVALVTELVDYCTSEAFVYKHEWNDGDVIIWDNRQAMHVVNHDYPQEEERIMRRTLVAGP